MSPTSDPPPASTPPASAPAPASQPAASQPAPGTPATADVVNQALAAVVAAFPPESSILQTLWLYSLDEQTATLTAEVNADPSDSDLQPIFDSITANFQALSIAQTATVLTCAPDGPPSSGSGVASGAAPASDGAPADPPAG